MKNLIIFICVILSFNIFAERYEGGYVDGKWFPFYRNNLSERICLEPNDGGDERIGCSGGLHGYISFKGGNITITGIAEINDTILFKVSDFNILMMKDILIILVIIQLKTRIKTENIFLFLKFLKRQ